MPDVAADADPATGYRPRVDGQTSVMGGTGAVAPLWAALVCRHDVSTNPVPVTAVLGNRSTAGPNGAGGGVP